METARAKQESVCNYIIEVAAENPERKFLVFAHHKEMLDAIEFTLTEKVCSILSLSPLVRFCSRLFFFVLFYCNILAAHNIHEDRRSNISNCTQRQRASLSDLQKTTGINPSLSLSLFYKKKERKEKGRRKELTIVVGGNTEYDSGRHGTDFE